MAKRSEFPGIQRRLLSPSPWAVRRWLGLLLVGVSVHVLLDALHVNADPDTRCLEACESALAKELVDGLIRTAKPGSSLLGLKRPLRLLRNRPKLLQAVQDRIQLLAR